MNRTLSFSEALQLLEEGRHQRAVWSEMVDYLGRFVDSEVKDAEQGIMADGCVEKVVPQAQITAIIHCVETEYITPLDAEIEALEKLQVVETEDDDGEEKAEAKPAKKKVSGKRPTPKAKAGKNKKTGRAVPRAVKPKVHSA